MSTNRMNREQFFGVVSERDEDRLRKALWNLYWRGTANVRERIEVELASGGHGRPPRPAKAPADPETVRYEVKNLADTEGGLLDRIVTHAALDGAEQTFLSARLAHRRGDTDVARDLTAQCLRKQPGHKDFHDFAAEIRASM